MDDKEASDENDDTEQNESQFHEVFRGFLIQHGGQCVGLTFLLIAFFSIVIIIRITTTDILFGGKMALPCTTATLIRLGGQLALIWTSSDLLKYRRIN